VPEPRRPFSPNDDRITELILTRTPDDGMAWEVQIDIFWAAAQT